MHKNKLRIFAIAAGLTSFMVLASPAAAAQWVPGHYGPGGFWHPGHWVGGYGTWIPGHYSPNGFWHPGHWAGGYGPPPGPYEGPPPGTPVYGQHWVPGWYGPNGGWHRGYWAPN